MKQHALAAISNLRLYLCGIGVIITSFLWVYPTLTLARVTPEDIVQTEREAYEKKVINYSQQHQQKLEILAQSIARVNKKRTDELKQIMVAQATVLDEYERRQNGKGVENTKKARYWITFAHEAVAYQAAKIYIFDLSLEGNIRSDALSTVSFFQSDLNSVRTKVIYSQRVLREVVGG